MAAPVAAREVLFPLYAFNVEVSRAPWLTEEPMIAEMRLQWWRDVLEEIGGGRPVRMHEVTTPLASVLSKVDAEILDRAIGMRRWDIYKDAFEDTAHFEAYIDATGGGLMWVAARLLGAGPAAEADIRAFGRATALTRFLMAVPELEARGRIPLVDGRAEAISALAKEALNALPGDGQLFRQRKITARAALFEGWQTRPLLKQIAKEPERVANGTIGLSPIRKRARLLRWA
jgi:phytoene synthase